MKKRVLIILFICASLIQIAIPLSMIAKRECALKTGEQFKFKVAPVDPFDAFRGRYVAIRIESDKVALAKDEHVRYGQKVFAVIGVNEDGFADLTAIKTTKPQNQPYISANISYVSNGMAHLSFPIDRYYMEEKAAPKAEHLYNQLILRGKDKKDSYITVRVKEGFVIIEQLYVGGKRVEEALKEVEKSHK